jgi:uncharacterized iron-regulated protein
VTNTAVFRNAFVVFLLSALLFLPSVSDSSHAPAPLFKVASGKTLKLNELVQEFEGVDILTIGEQHDNVRHHQVQLAVISALHEAEVEIAIGFEMFQADSQTQLDKWVDGNISEDTLFKVYSGDWEVDWYLGYREIFLYARDHEIPMVGLNVSRELVTRVAEEGFSSLTEEEKGDIRVVSCSIDQEYKDILAKVLGHKGSKDRIFGRFCEAQVVWDTGMAINALDYIGSRKDALMVVLAGNFHAWKRGIPEQVTRRSEAVVKALLPASDDSYINYDVFLEQADYVWWEE